MARATLYAIPSGTFSSVMDSLTEITGEFKDVWGKLEAGLHPKDVWGKLEAGLHPSVIQPSDKNHNTDMSIVKPSVPTFAEYLMKNEAGNRDEMREETASASTYDRRYCIITVCQSQGCHCPSPSQSYGTSLLDVSTPSTTADDIKGYLEEALFLIMNLHLLEKNRTLCHVKVCKKSSSCP